MDEKNVWNVLGKNERREETRSEKKGKERMISEETITNRLLECQGMNGRNKL